MPFDGFGPNDIGCVVSSCTLFRKFEKYLYAQSRLVNGHRQSGGRTAFVSLPAAGHGWCGVVEKADLVPLKTRFFDTVNIVEYGHSTIIRSGRRSAFTIIIMHDAKPARYRRLSPFRRRTKPHANKINTHMKRPRTRNLHTITNETTG